MTRHCCSCDVPQPTAKPVESSAAHVLRASGLMRLFIEQLGAMAKLKGKTGQQKVVVEHVHVHSGGQAVVGTVASPHQEQEK